MDKYANGYITIPFNSDDFDVFDESSTYLKGDNLMSASKMAQLCIDGANKPKKLFELRSGVFVDVIVNVDGYYHMSRKTISLLFVSQVSVEYIVKKEIFLEYIPSEDDEAIYEWAYTDGNGERTDYATAYVYNGNPIQ